MRKFKLLLLSGVITFVLIVFALFILQTTKNSEPQEIRINEKMTNKEFDQYVKQELGIGIPLGMAFWGQKIGFRVQNCRFVVAPNTTVYGFLQQLRANRNQVVDIVIPSGIFSEELMKILHKKTFITKDDFNKYITSSDFYDKYGMDERNWPSLIIPNTYNVSVNMDIEQFFIRMKKESDLFWTSVRLSKLRKQKLSIQEAVTLASIVQKESLKQDEYELIAGVYLNRLRINMPLGADPTLVFIRGKGGRVYNKDIQRNSPYNTYKNKGLPPGPICIPSKEALDGVLNYGKHEYLYFCAKSDLSGYHVYERHYKNHLLNARKFQKVLDKQTNKN